MLLFEKGRYRVRKAETEAEIRAAQDLRALAFTGDISGPDQDEYDKICDHILVEDQKTGALVACYRLLYLDSGALIEQSYAARFYDLSALHSYKGSMLELGRFCLHPDHNDPDIVRAAWAGMTRIVDGREVEMLFGCSSFEGCDADAHRQAFALLRARHLAPKRWQPKQKAAEVVVFASDPVLPKALRRIPPLLRTYLAMGGWVSDHAVVDREMNTMHVFTGVEISAIPESRKRILRAVAK